MHEKKGIRVIIVIRVLNFAIEIYLLQLQMTAKEPEQKYRLLVYEIP